MAKIERKASSTPGAAFWVPQIEVRRLRNNHQLSNISEC